MQAGLFFVAAVVWLLAILLIVGGGICLSRGEKGLGTGLLTVGIGVTLAPFAVVAWLASPLADPTEIRVEGFDPVSDPPLVIELRHRVDSDTATEYRFGKAGDPHHVVSVFQEQHPDGVVTLEPGAEPRVGDSIWHLSTDNVRWDLTYLVDSDWYALALQVVDVIPEDGGEPLRIPFPRSALGAEVVKEGQPYVNGWTMDEWQNFYADIPSAEIGANWIIVKSVEGEEVIIGVNDGITIVSASDLNTLMFYE